MEMLWQGSATLDDASVFTGNFASGKGSGGDWRSPTRCWEICVGTSDTSRPPLAGWLAGWPAAGNYGPPEGFAFEWACPPIMDDERLGEYNVEDRCIPCWPQTARGGCVGGEGDQEDSCRDAPATPMQLLTAFRHVQGGCLCTAMPRAGQCYARK